MNEHLGFGAVMIAKRTREKSLRAILAAYGIQHRLLRLVKLFLKALRDRRLLFRKGVDNGKLLFIPEDHQPLDTVEEGILPFRVI